MSSPPVQELRGQVNGGQQPVSGANIALYAAGSSGYAPSTANTSILTSTVTTDTNGGFTITGLYTCPSGASQMYLVATGGDAGAGTNSSLALMAALGTCSNLSSSTHVVINEVTTVAAVYALAPFMATNAATPGGSLGASSTNSQGITQAFATANNLVDTSAGAASGASLPTSATVPVAELNSLADIIAPCVNSNGSSGECSTLFADATPSGGSAPQNTIDALFDIAQNPSNNVTALNNLVTGTAPFRPTLSSAPNDWSMAINYTDTTLNSPQALVVDSGGNIWVGNNAGNSLTKFSNSGTVLSGASGYTGGGLSGPRWAAFDTSGNIWLTNGNDSLSKFNSSGTALSGAGGYTGNGLSSPQGIASYRNILISVMNNSSNQTSSFRSTGSAYFAPYTTTDLTNPYGVAAIGNGIDVWVTSANNMLFDLEIDNFFNTSTSGGGLNAPRGVAVDSSSNAWVANSGGASLSEFNSSGTALSGSSGYTGGGLVDPSQIAIDGLNHVWAANPTGNCLSEFSNGGVAISGSTGYTGGGLSNPQGIGIDGSGNVWVANFSTNKITEFVGAAAPVRTPLATAAQNNQLGARP